MSTGDEIVRVEESEIERFEALGLGRYDAIRAVEAGIDRHAVERLVHEESCPPGVALEVARQGDRAAGRFRPTRGCYELS